MKGKVVKGRTGVGERANILAAFAYDKLLDGTKVAQIVPGGLAIRHGNNKSKNAKGNKHAVIYIHIYMYVYI